MSDTILEKSQRKIAERESGVYNCLGFEAMTELMKDFKKQYPDALDGDYYVNATETYVGEGEYYGGFLLTCNEYETDTEFKKRIETEKQRAEQLEKQEYEQYLKLKNKFEGAK